MSQTALPRATTTAQGLSGDPELVDPLTVARELGDRRREGVFLGHLGILRFGMGRL